jgi:hypothetical protein
MGSCLKMMAVLKLEIIGDNYLQHLKLIEQGKVPQPHLKKYIRLLKYGRKKFRPWVACLRGLDEKYGFAREFIVGMRDYSQANSIGSRGVFEYFALGNGLYEVNECVRLGRARRYFIKVEDLEITEITREEVEEWLLRNAA